LHRTRPGCGAFFPGGSRGSRLQSPDFPRRTANAQFPERLPEGEMKNPALSVFIPAYNAADTLAQVVDRIPKDLWADIGTVVIVNDGSTDATGRVARSLMRKYPKVKLHDFETNRGYGQAVRRGLGYCRESGSEYSACLRADGQYPPEKLVLFLDQMQNRGLDI